MGYCTKNKQNLNETRNVLQLETIYRNITFLFLFSTISPNPLISLGVTFCSFQWTAIEVVFNNNWLDRLQTWSVLIIKLFHPGGQIILTNLKSTLLAVVTYAPQVHYNVVIKSKNCQIRLANFIRKIYVSLGGLLASNFPYGCCCNRTSDKLYARQWWRQDKSDDLFKGLFTPNESERENKNFLWSLSLLDYLNNKLNFFGTILGRDVAFVFGQCESVLKLLLFKRGMAVLLFFSDHEIISYNKIKLCKIMSWSTHEIS